MQNSITELNNVEVCNISGGSFAGTIGGMVVGSVGGMIATQLMINMIANSPYTCVGNGKHGSINIFGNNPTGPFIFIPLRSLVRLMAEAPGVMGLLISTVTTGWMVGKAVFD